MSKVAVRGGWVDSGVDGVQVAEIGEMLASEPVISRPVLDVVQQLGEASIDFVAFDGLMRTALVQMPPQAATEAIHLCGTVPSKNGRYHSLAHFTKDFIAGSKVIGALPPEEILVPVGELHRPKVQGCQAEYAFSRQAERGLDFKVSIAGTGFGYELSQSIGFGRKFRTTEDCLEFVMPAKVQAEEVRTRRGETYWRVNVLGLDYKRVRAKAISSERDPCGKYQPAGSPWLSSAIDMPIPAGVTQEEELPVQVAQGCKFEVGFKVAGIELGITSTVKTLRDIAYRYELVGPHTYEAYQPQGRIAYYWNWRKQPEDTRVTVSNNS